MPEQLTVRLPADLRRALDVAARTSERKRSEIVRMALREFLEVGRSSERPPSSRVRSLIGSLESGIPDLAERHREYVLEALRQTE